MDYSATCSGFRHPTVIDDLMVSKVGGLGSNAHMVPESLPDEEWGASDQWAALAISMVLINEGAEAIDSDQAEEIR